MRFTSCEVVKSTERKRNHKTEQKVASKQMKLILFFVAAFKTFESKAELDPSYAFLWKVSKRVSLHVLLPTIGWLSLQKCHQTASRLTRFETRMINDTRINQIVHQGTSGPEESTCDSPHKMVQQPDSVRVEPRRVKGVMAEAH